MSSFYLTTPIYYVNAKPHLGHAYTTIVADVLTRFHSLCGENAIFITGTDEHGDKIAQAALKENKSPQEFADSISQLFQNLLSKTNAKADSFIRTTSTQHVKYVQDFLQKVYDAGDIYFGEYGGHYCYGCERFYPEKELENGLCPQHLTKPTFIQEKNYFFRMSKYKDWLREHIQENPHFISPERYKKEALALLETDGLEDLCISRPKSRLEWGIELPFDSDYVCYVWFDALLSYLSVLGDRTEEKYATFWPHAEHLIAKDILKPHALFWPTMLKSANVPVYKHLHVHGYWLVQGTKMSKSLGNIVEPLEMIDKYGVDIFRYFLLREMVFGNDASFSEEALVQRLNADLANDLGNLFSRVLSMVNKYNKSMVPKAFADREEERALKELAKNSLLNYIQLFKSARFSQGIEALWEYIRAMNKYVDTVAPWTLAKEEKTDELSTVLYTLVEGLRKVAIFLWPIMPTKAEQMLSELNVSFSPEKLVLEDELRSFEKIKAGTLLSKSSNLFPRKELEVVDKVAEAKTSKQKKATDSLATTASFEDFKRLDIRTGTIVSSVKHPDADSLLCLSVDLGAGVQRQIISGLANSYSPDDLIGKQALVLMNLPEKKIRGKESQGMILTVEDSNGKIFLLSPSEHVKNGSKIS